VDDSARDSLSAEGAPGLLARWLGGTGEQDPGSKRSVYYQYLDDGGSVHFVRSLDQVPPAWRDRAGRVEMDKPRVQKVAAPARPANRGRRAFSDVAVPVRHAGGDVVVYTTPWCGWCRKTLAWLDRRGIDYENRDIEANDRNRSELIEKTGRTSIPVVEIDGELIRGFNPSRMGELLGTS
jgi:glutaredoxin